MPDVVRPRRRWYALPVGTLLGSVGVGALLFWLVVRPLLDAGAGSPVRILVAFVVLVLVVTMGFLVSFVAGLVIAVRRSRARRAPTDEADETRDGQ